VAPKNEESATKERGTGDSEGSARDPSASHGLFLLFPTEGKSVML
jgi:hypothetical protein